MRTNTQNEYATSRDQLKTALAAIDTGKLRTVYFVACGGSRATLLPGYYLLDRECPTVATACYTAQEFTLAPPARLGPGSLVVLNSQSGGTAETCAAATLAKQLGAATIGFTTAPGSALEKLCDHIIYYYDDPADPYPAALTIFPEVYELGFGLADLLNGTSRLPEVATAMQSLQATLDAAVADTLGDARRFARSFKDEPILYTVAAGLNNCVSYVMTNCLIMESLWRHSSPLDAGELFHGAFEAIGSDTAVFALVGTGPTRPMEERAVKFLQRFTGKLTVLDAAALDLSAYPGWLHPWVGALVLNRLCASYIDEMSFVLGHPVSSRRYMGVEKY